MEYNLELFHPREKSANFLLFICIYYCWLLAFLGAYGFVVPKMQFEFPCGGSKTVNTLSLPSWNIVYF